MKNERKKMAKWKNNNGIRMAVAIYWEYRILVEYKWECGK